MPFGTISVLKVPFGARGTRHSRRTLWVRAERCALDPRSGLDLVEGIYPEAEPHGHRWIHGERLEGHLRGM